MDPVKRKANPKIVAAAIIEENGRVRIARRKRGKWHVGKWEFPGGTVEEGETNEECLKRELMEELAVTAEVGDLLCSSEHVNTPDWTTRLFAYRARIVSGTVMLHDHEEMRWVNRADLGLYDFAEIGRSILERLMGESQIREE